MGRNLERGWGYKNNENNNNTKNTEQQSKKKKKRHTNPTALNTLIPNASFHSSTLLSPTFFTGSNDPWLITTLSSRPHRDFAKSTAFAASEGSLMSPASTSTRSDPYW